MHQLFEARDHEIGQRLSPSCDIKRDDFYKEIDACLNGCASDHVIGRRGSCGRSSERQGREQWSRTDARAWLEQLELHSRTTDGSQDRSPGSRDAELRFAETRLRIHKP